MMKAFAQFPANLKANTSFAKSALKKQHVSAANRKRP